MWWDGGFGLGLRVEMRGMLFAEHGAWGVGVWGVGRGKVRIGPHRIISRCLLVVLYSLPTVAPHLHNSGRYVLFTTRSRWQVGEGGEGRGR